MTQSWLVSAYRHCNTTKVNTRGPGLPSDVVCPNATALAAFEAAVRRNDIVWHAFPFNAEPELFTPALFDAALNLTFAEDAHFGHAPRRTLSQRDVPGLTRAAIPLLARRGVKAVSVGENSQVAPSAVPPIFVWRDNATGTQVLALFHALGYGGAFPATSEASGHATATGDAVDADDDDARHDRAAHDDGPSLYVHHPHGGGGPTGGAGVSAGAGGAPSPPRVQGSGASGSRNEACVSVEAAGVALCYAWKIDNSGPHTYNDSKLLFRAARDLYPGAVVVASDAMDDFVQDVLPFMASLPVVTQEIGDTWIMGASADPLKVALFRAASRVHARCVADHSCVARAGGPGGEGGEGALRDFERLLMVAGEHTWGWNGGGVRLRSWSNAELARSLRTDREFQTAVVGWVEQRAILRNAVAALPPGSLLARDIAAAFREIEGPPTLHAQHPGGLQGSKGASIAAGSRPPAAERQRKRKRRLGGEQAAAPGSDGDRGARGVGVAPIFQQPASGGDMREVGSLSAPVRCGDMDVGFGPDGSIVHLQRSGAGNGGGPMLADARHPLARVWYHGMDKEYFKRYVHEYVAGVSRVWPDVTAAEALFKPGLNLRAVSANATLVRIRTDDRSTVVLDLSFPVEAHEQRGAPSTAQATLVCGLGLGRGSTPASQQNDGTLVWGIGIFLDFVRLTTQAPPMGRTCGEPKRNRIDRRSRMILPLLFRPPWRHAVRHAARCHGGQWRYQHDPVHAALGQQNGDARAGDDLDVEQAAAPRRPRRTPGGGGARARGQYAGANMFDR